MYRDEYDIVKCPSVNIIKHHDKTEIGTVKLTYEDKKYDDITRVRAIAMTDDKICWIDNVDYKYVRAYEDGKSSSSSKSTSKTRRQQLLDDFHIDADAIVNAVTEGIHVIGSYKKGEKTIWDNVTDIWAGDDNKLKIELPRIISLLDPVFTLHQLGDKEKAIKPKENYLNGNNIRLLFDYEPKEGDQIPLYIYSDYINLKVDIDFRDGKPTVKKIGIV